jgi:hypothetical protein
VKPNPENHTAEALSTQRTSHHEVHAGQFGKAETKVKLDLNLNLNLFENPLTQRSI